MILIKRYLVFVHFLMLMLFDSKAIAQHQNVFSNYVINNTMINPAATGRDEALDLNAYTRKQWVGFDGSPTSTNISLNCMIKRPSVNVGCMFQDDRIGATSTQNLFGMYAYRINFRKLKLKLSFGIQGGMQVLNTDLTSLKRNQESDIVISNTSRHKVNFVCGTGIYLHRKNFFVGLSTPYMYNSINKFSIRNAPVYFNGGLLFKCRNKTDLIKPSFLIRKIGASPASIDLNLTYYLYSKIGIGISYRNKSAVVGMVEIVLHDQLKINYAYDWSTTSISKYQTGSHELSFKYLFGKKLNIANPRALFL